MSSAVDLMPTACRMRLGHRSWVRGWLVIYGVAAAVLLLAITATEIREQSLKLSVAALQKKVDFSVEQRRKAIALGEEIGLYEQALQHQDNLGLPIRVTTALRELGACTPESVTLTSLNMVPRLVRERSVKPNEPAVENQWLVFELRGVAPSDTDLAQFVATLEADPLFTSTAVDYTTQTEIRGRVAREFGVTCEISLSRRFELADGGRP